MLCWHPENLRLRAITIIEAEVPGLYEVRKFLQMVQLLLIAYLLIQNYQLPLDLPALNQLVSKALLDLR